MERSQRRAAMRSLWGLGVLVLLAHCSRQGPPPPDDTDSISSTSSSSESETGAGYQAYDGEGASSSTDRQGEGGQGIMAPTQTTDTEESTETSDGGTLGVGGRSELGEEVQCPVFASSVARSRPKDGLNEASGLVQSLIDTERLYAHNDSGDSARLFALDLQGHLKSIYFLDTPFPRDWEDMAAFMDDQGQAWLLLADMGDNDRVREQVSFLLVQEPEQVEIEEPLSVITRELSYPDGPHNAEAILVVADEMRAYLVTKSRPSRLYSFPIEDTTSVLEFEGEVGRHWPSGLIPTGADRSASHPWIALRGEEEAAVFIHKPGETVLAALNQEPCKLSLAKETQGEAIAFDAEDNLFTLDEATSPLHYYARE